MDQWLHAAVPRKLRLRASIQISNIRLPLRLFGALLALLVVWFLLLMAGADLRRTSYSCIALGLALAGLLEGRFAGRPTSAAAGNLARHLRRAKRLRLEPLMLSLPAEAAAPLPIRRPRWQRSAQQESGDG